MRKVSYLSYNMTTAWMQIIQMESCQLDVSLTLSEMLKQKK